MPMLLTCADPQPCSRSSLDTFVSDLAARTMMPWRGSSTTSWDVHWSFRGTWGYRTFEFPNSMELHLSLFHCFPENGIQIAAWTWAKYLRPGCPADFFFAFPGWATNLASSAKAFARGRPCSKRWRPRSWATSPESPKIAMQQDETTWASLIFDLGVFLMMHTPKTNEKIGWVFARNSGRWLSNW